MKLDKTLIDELTVTPGQRAELARRSTTSTSVDPLGSTKKERQEVAETDLQSSIAELKEAQELLWASDTFAVLVVLQAMDAAGKDGTIKHVMSGLNPQGCQVVAFKQPTSEELDHDFLWRYSKALPERGRIGIFNRSYYEEVLVTRVHPELLVERGHARGNEPTNHRWQHRYEDINAFEHHLHRGGTRIVKIFLHLSRDEQKRRFLNRLTDPDKYWKFSAADLAEREHWEEYQVAYEEALSATSTPWAPWYVVPADRKYALRALVGGILVHTIAGLGLELPRLTPAELETLAHAKDRLLAE